LAKLLTLVAIPAIFLTTALPSYAFAPEGAVAGATAQRSVVAQSVSVAAAAAAVTITADGFTSTSQAEIDQIEAQEQADIAAEAAARSAAAGFAVYGIRAEGDDYPWPTAQTDDQGGGLSPLGYYYRECVDFVAWRLNRDAGSTNGPWKWTWGKLTPGGGNGSAWASGWAAKGWPTGKEPVVGSVASFSYNHVAYVQSVPGDGTVVLEEYNWMGSHAYHTRTVPISEVKLFLYPPS
jgi:surface antigen